jgi:hypothetical protein
VIHIAAVTQLRHRHSPGRTYYDRKRTHGRTARAALRSLKRRISDAIYRRLLADAARSSQGPGRAVQETTPQACVTGPTS